MDSQVNEIMAFTVENHRRPSKHNPEERNARNWLRHSREQMDSGD